LGLPPLFVFAGQDGICVAANRADRHARFGHRSGSRDIGARRQLLNPRLPSARETPKKKERPENGSTSSPSRLKSAPHHPHNSQPPHNGNPRDRPLQDFLHNVLICATESPVHLALCSVKTPPAFSFRARSRVACQIPVRIPFRNPSRVYIVFLLENNEQIYETLAKPHLGAFFAPQKTGLSGAPRFRAPAPTFGRYAAKRRGCSAPLQSLALLRCLPPADTSRPQAPQGVSIIPMLDT
jgi:hypothetical protein